MLAAATAAAAIVVATMAVRVGHAGGQLVYGHNAAAAYAANGKRVATGDTGTTTERAAHEDDDDR